MISHEDAQGWAPIPRSLLYDPEVPLEAKVAYAALASHVNAKTGLCIPSMHTMASYLGISRVRLRKAIKWLSEHGYISFEERKTGSGYMAHSYVLTYGSGVVPSGGSKSDPGGFKSDPGVGSNRSLNEKKLITEEEEPPLKTPPATKANGAGVLSTSFEGFWMAYPRHIAKAAARRKFDTLVKNGADPQAIIGGAARYARVVADRDPQYVKHPTTWLNGGCWDDEDDGVPDITPPGVDVVEVY